MQSENDRECEAGRGLLEENEKKKQRNEDKGKHMRAVESNVEK